ncbi:tetratricopeptide repeat protein [Hyphobacterium sp.]|uniref:tetratricopeptide repeat protein n=1 Tax=Hyphobacterium sp. TaxID=2004662 RepID=UPI003BAA4A04
MKYLVTGGILAALVSGSAMAQVTVIYGQTPAVRCYENAAQEMIRASDLDACDEALETEFLSARDRRSTWVNRAVINLNIGNPATALQDLDRAVELGFNGPEIALNQSTAFVHLQQYEAAVDAATRALDEGLEDQHKAYYNRAIANEHLGRIAEAYADLRMAVEAAPGWQLPVQQLERYSVSNGS